MGSAGGGQTENQLTFNAREECEGVSPEAGNRGRELEGLQPDARFLTRPYILGSRTCTRVFPSIRLTSSSASSHTFFPLRAALEPLSLEPRHGVRAFQQ